MSSASAETMKLPAVLDLAAAEQLLLELRQHLQADEPLCLDASRVETITMPCMQLILSAVKSASSVIVTSPSVAFDSAFSDLAFEYPRAPDLVPAQEPVQAESEEITDDQPVAEESNTPEPPTEAPVMSKRILTIDDSKTIRDMLRMTLIDAGFEVLQAEDGQQGCEVMDKETVDLVITDINMPRMNGYDVVRNLRARPELKGLPILVLTTESDADKKNLAREAGATGWMVKPFDPDRLIATVRKVIPN